MSHLTKKGWVALDLDAKGIMLGINLNALGAKS